MEKIVIFGAGKISSALLSLHKAHQDVFDDVIVGIIDNDIVELSNLNRQYIHSPLYLGKDKVESAKCRIEEFNKDIQIKTFKTRLNAENYKNIVDGYNFIVDCFDSFESKFLLKGVYI